MVEECLVRSIGTIQETNELECNQVEGGGVLADWHEHPALVSTTAESERAIADSDRFTTASLGVE